MNEKIIRQRRFWNSLWVFLPFVLLGLGSTAQAADPPTCDTVGIDAFTACYYNNKDFTDLKVVRTDPAVNFNLGNSSPDPAIDPDTFSVVWNGNFTFEAGEYQFNARTDDGMRVYVDDALILDKFYDQGATTYAVNQTMASGTHKVTVKYYENTGDAVAQLSWVKSTTPPPPTCGTFGTNAFTGCYYNNQDFTDLKVVRTDPAINFSFGYGSPDPAIAPDTFSAHWEGDFTFEEGAYNFTARTDDGMKVWVDNQLVLDKFYDQPPTTYPFSRTMTAGIHRVKVEYYENGGEAAAQLSWAKASTTQGIHIINPINGSDVSGVAEVKGVVDGRDINSYTMGWRVGDGAYTDMSTDSGAMVKHNFIDFSPWNWRSDNIYHLEFQAKNLDSSVIGTTMVQVHVVH